MRSSTLDAGPTVRTRLASLVHQTGRLAERTSDPRLRAQVLAVCRALDAPEPCRNAVLSARETDVLALVAGGCGNKPIAALLGTTPDAVKAHLRSAMRALGAQSRHAAVSTARSRGLLT